MGLGSVLAIRAQVDSPCATCLTSIILVTALLCGLEAWREPLRVSTTAAATGTRAEGPESGWGMERGRVVLRPSPGSDPHSHLRQTHLS